MRVLTLAIVAVGLIGATSAMGQYVKDDPLNAEHIDHLPKEIRAAVLSYVPDKAERVHRFHANTLRELANILAAAGLRHPSEIGPHHLARRISISEIQQFFELHAFLEPGELLGKDCGHKFYARNWALASADRFEALAS